MKDTTITIDGQTFKEIIVDGQTFLYRNINYDDGTYYSEWTDFYQGEEQQKVFQLCFWRPSKFKNVPKLVFTVKEDIESISLTADDVLRMIRRKIALMDRQAQIERGEILPTEAQTEKQNGFMGSHSISNQA